MLHLCSADATSVALLDFSAVKMQHLESWFTYIIDLTTTLRLDIAYDMFTDVTTGVKVDVAA